ncbi:MAG: transposase [Chloroflexi bacterium HGW-Chloroflexi-5]|nr:MAG: transposase [Chloroflexi bacterium HGW-Chloroflexi-5]
MARRERFKMTTSERRRRHFSDNFKIQKVRELETGKVKISELCEQYELADISVYRWLNKFGSMKGKKERIVIETDSDTKQLLELKKKLAELERIIGQKQVQLDFKDKMIELAEEMYGVDIKKKFSIQPSSTSGNTGKNTPTA